MINSLKATKREAKTAGQLNALRTKGLIPAILYGGKNPNLKISVEEKYLNEIFDSESFLSTVINLNIDGKTEKVCRVKQLETKQIAYKTTERKGSNY